MGININCVLPGGMLTMWNFRTEQTPELAALSQSNPHAPMTDADEVARVVFALSTRISRLHAR
jgi:hypothetical protein